MVIKDKVLSMKELIAYYKENYRKGDKIFLKKMKGEKQMPYGLKGVVDFVDDAGQIHVNWDNGSTLALVPEEDDWIKFN